MERLTPSEIIANNKRFIEENDIKNWKEFHAKVIEIRLSTKEAK